MTENDHRTEAKVLQLMIEKLAPLEMESRSRLVETLAKFFDIQLTSTAAYRSSVQPQAPSSLYGIEIGDDHYPDATQVSPKEFLKEKQPRTLGERVACLAFYLTHNRNVPHFKTIDISKLNTEAAQTKFSNTAQSVNDATKAGFLVAAGKGNKQISAVGEDFVKALPNHDEARAIMKKAISKKPRKKKTKTKNKKS